MSSGRWVLAFGLLVLASGCRRSEARAHLEKARAELFEKHPEAALSEYRAALDGLENDESPEAQVLRARALRGAADTYYLEMRDFRRAAQVYRELTRRCPEAPETLEGRINLGTLLAREFKDPRGAIAELSAALARNPPQGDELAYRVAKLYFELGNYNQSALEALTVVRKYENSNLVDDAMFLRGQALSMTDDQKPAAERALLELVDRFPNSELKPHALFELGKIKADAGEFEKAIDVWIEALKTHPEPAVVQSVIARVRRQLRATTPAAIGDATKAFDRNLAPQPIAAKPKNSIEAVGGTAEEAAREASMSNKGGALREVP